MLSPSAPPSSDARRPLATARVRPATLADVDAIVALVQSAYRGDESRKGWTTEADLLHGQRTDPREIAELLGDPTARLLLAEASDELAGSVYVRREEGAGYVGMFAVRPMLQGSGLGRLLLAEAEAFLRREWGSTRARMTVLRQRIELIGWYERRGYINTGRREPFPYGDERFGLPRRTDLEFVVLEKSLA